MPSPTAFAKAFGLTPGAMLEGGWRVTSVTISHEQLERFRRYAFPLTVTLAPRASSSRRRTATSAAASASAALDAVRSAVVQPHIVLSRYGNPYACAVDDVALAEETSGDRSSSSSSSEVTVTAMGDARRVPRGTRATAAAAPRAMRGVKTRRTASPAPALAAPAPPATPPRKQARVA